MTLISKKIAFFGSPRFSEIILKKIIDSGIIPKMVVCNPDRPAGRKKEITPPKTKILSQEQGIYVWQPESLYFEKWQREVNRLEGIDLAIVVSYAKIIPKEIIDSLPGKFLGIHPSLLPKYRGTTPIQSVILKNEKKTGTTIFLIDENVDHGPIISSYEMGISKTDTYSSLHDKLAELSADLLIKTLPDLLEKKIKPKEQEHDKATMTKKFKTEDAFIPPTDLEIAQIEGGKIASEIDKKVRALNPEPGTWTLQGKKQERTKILATNLTQEGKLKIKRIQKSGKKEVNL